MRAGQIIAVLEQNPFFNFGRWFTVDRKRRSKFSVRVQTRVGLVERGGLSCAGFRLEFTLAPWRLGGSSGARVRHVRSVLLALVAVCVPGLATAETRGSIGASAGVSEDADQGLDASKTLGLWGRIGLSKRLAVQLEIERAKEDYSCSS